MGIKCVIFCVANNTKTLTCFLHVPKNLNDLVKLFIELIMSYALLIGLAFIENLNTYFVPLNF